jgi:hypothetical protein
MAIATSVSSSVQLTQLDFEASAPSPKQPYPLGRMEWNPFDVTQQRRYYTRGPPPVSPVPLFKSIPVLSGRKSTGKALTNIE